MTDDATGQQEDRKDNVEVSPHMTTTVAQSTRKGWGRWRGVLCVAWWCCVVLSCICLVASAYGGCINPEITSLGATMAMALPIFIMIVIVVGIISLWISRWGAAVCAAVLIACSGPILEYAPVNFPRKMPDEQELRDNSFTFMSYNVFGFTQFPGVVPNDTTNPTISYILKEDPDVACLIECLTLNPHFYSHVTQMQIDSLTTRYPYYKIGAEGSSLFSKYPITPIEIEKPNSFANQVSAFNVSIHGRDVTVIAVHLASWGLGNDDRAMYNNFTHLGVLGKIWGVRQQWYDK
ncbi:MAG: hypothetical protein K2L81_07885, partial [Muribaculaceae bacterium]|nr:hypothetical protein [Muribaculaceae bacterium]